MSTDRQQDDDLDRLLRATLRRDSAIQPDACPDAGMLAAFVEGGVSVGERTAVESHLAACGRCQETLAAMDLEAPASSRAPAPVSVGVAAGKRPWLWRGHLHWLIPVSAASLLVIYLASKPAIAPDFPPGRPAQPTQMADARPPQLPPAVFVERTAPPPAAVTDKGRSGMSERVVRAPAAPAQPPAGARQMAQAHRPEAAPAFAPEPVPEKAKGEREVAAGTMARRAAQDAEVPKKAADQAAPQGAPAAPPPATVPVAALPAAAAPRTMDVVATATAPPPAAEGILVRAAPFDPVVVSAPGGQVQWRVGPNGGIWRSADEGRTWYPQKSGVKSALWAAAAPSVNACWAVGADGTVLLTDNGERWERRPFPERADLVMVDARSSHEAVVTTRDGRRFSTTDRGATWTIR